MHSLALLALAGMTVAQYKGFNYGSTTNDGAVRVQQDFEDEFNRARSLQGQSGFTAARLYTMIQGNTADTVTSAIPAAINSKTSLLLGLWASAGQASFSNEIIALKNAINQYGTSFTDLIAGISIGSEDLYRVSPTGIENMSGAGSTPDELVSYIGQVRDAISGTAASGAQIGHVDTWTAWVNGSNAAVINAVDWLGMDGYPYYQTTQANSIANAETLFFDSYDATVAVAGGKDVWVTETGWPYQGPDAGQAVASVQNAELYWQQVACRLLGNVNTFWFTLQDPKSSTSDISFGLIGNDLNSAPLYDLACGNSTSSSSSSSSSPSSPSSTVATSASVATLSPSSTAASPTQPTTSVAANSPSIVTSPGVEATTSTSAAQSSTTYACNPAHAYPTGEVCTEINGSLTLITTKGNPTSTEQSTTLVTLTSYESSTSQTATPASQSTSITSSPSSPASPSGTNCLTNLDGQFEYPHLIVPVDSANPSKAYGTSYNGEINPTISSIFNFDIPASDAGKTCSLVFLFPSQKDLQTSSYIFNGMGGIKVTELTSPATEQTTYQNQPAAGALTQEIVSVAPGNEYLIFSHECGAGLRVAFEFSSIGGLDLTYFQDYNSSPIGAYITVC